MNYREVEKQLRKAGFAPEWGKGSHRKWTHPSGKIVVMKSNRLSEEPPQWFLHRLEQTLKGIP